MNGLPETNESYFSLHMNSANSSGVILDKKNFTRVLCHERKRIERSGGHMLLAAVELAEVAELERVIIMSNLTSSLTESMRETDYCGWLTENLVVGMLFTGVEETALSAAKQIIAKRLGEVLSKGISPENFRKTTISIEVFPDDNKNKNTETIVPLFYPELLNKNSSDLVVGGIKRFIDIAGSVFAIVLLMPLFTIIPILVKLTSPGPALFRQTRLGRFGTPFTFLKFRTMYTNNEDGIHRKFITEYIAAKQQGEVKDNGEKIYKITNDPRVTPLGHFLRKTSLDELPQFFNVLFGHMSLVGPRPPIPYEVEQYDNWHTYRVLARKPGITGLWQVRGRSLTTFDEMVRLDLHYIKNWSLWLDIKLLLATPFAVFRGKGAY